jgi:hypothetical protein
MRSLLQPDGLMIVRVFTQLQQKEPPESIVAEIRSSEHFDYWAMRYRFITSLQTSAEAGIYAGTLPTDQALERYGVGADEFIAKTNHRRIPMPVMPPEGMDGLLINFPTDRQFIEALSASFGVAQTGHGDHQLASRCPVYCLSPL